MGVVAGGSADHCEVRSADGSLRVEQVQLVRRAVKRFQSPIEVSHMEPVQRVRRAAKRFQSLAKVSCGKLVQLERRAVKRYQSPIKVSRVEPGRVAVI